MNGTLHSIRVAGVMLGLMAALACSNSVRAQNIQGKFVLPFDVQWQGKTLPAGEYHFILPSVNPGGVLFIRDGQRHGKMMVMTQILGGKPSGGSALTIVERNGKRCVRSLALEPIGATLVYLVPSHKTDAEREREASVRVIPVELGG
jgi:hypothetical protein